MGQAKLHRGISVAMALCMLVPSLTLAEDRMHFASLVDGSNLPEKKRTSLDLYMTAKEVGSFLANRDDALLIDIRTRAEISFLGIATDAHKNIPYMVMDDFWEFDATKGTYKMVVNPDFSDEIDDLVAERGLSKDTPIILMCRSGSRSARAASLLGRLGYTSVYSVVDGFEGDKSADGARNVNGWKNAGLTWSYKIRPEQAY